MSSPKPCTKEILFVHPRELPAPVPWIKPVRVGPVPDLRTQAKKIPRISENNRSGVGSRASVREWHRQEASHPVAGPDYSGVLFIGASLERIGQTVGSPREITTRPY